MLACHNVEHFIEDAFDSIIRQSAFADFEVIPVDDGSTDGTRKLIERYQQQYPDNFFPIFFDQGSGGPGRPRNAGIDHARAPYVIFMDPDDRIHQDGYTRLLDVMETHRSDIVIGTRYGVRERQGPDSRVWTDYVVKDEFFNQDSYALKVDLLVRRPVILKSIYRMALIHEHGIRFPEGISSSEDEIFDMKYLLLSTRITKINDVVYLYTVERAGSITSNIGLKLYRDLPEVFSGLDDALSTYFNQAVVSYRLAGLLRAFYFPKLLFLDPDLLTEALDITRAACEGYGFDKLLLTENWADRTMVELLRDSKYPQLMLFFMNQRLSAMSRTVRAQNKKLKVTRRRSVKAASRLSTYARLARRATAEVDPRMVLMANATRLLGSKPNGYWLFMDRRDKAADNGEALYRYVKDNKIHDKIAFIIRKDCPDFARLRAAGFNLVPYDSVEHWRMLYACEQFFASHVDDVIITPWARFSAVPREPRYRLNFLQHGIIRSDLSSWLGSKTYNVFCASARPEYQSLLDNLNYKLSPDTLKLTGLARHDLLERRSGDYILVSPTWRSFLAKASKTEFRVSEFYRAWCEFLADERLRSALRGSGVRIKLLLHSSLSQFRDCFDQSEEMEVLSYNDIASFADLISGAQMLVTDYSTISFDTLYLRRPVVYYSFPESRQHSTNVGENTEIYSALGYRHTELRGAVDSVVACVRRGFEIEDEKLRHIDEFFAYSDTSNRKRIIDAVLEKKTVG